MSIVEEMQAFLLLPDHKLRNASIPMEKLEEWGVIEWTLPVHKRFVPVASLRHIAPVGASTSVSVIRALVRARLAQLVPLEKGE